MFKAKEKASILWLISKAYNKQIPKELKDPYYKNAREEEVLKPQIIQGLTSCELYSMALSYIYEDLNYADLDHIGIIHLLIKKGVQVIEPNDIDLTETALMQNAPIRMTAHMAIIDAMMSLFAKDVLIPEKIVEVVSRFAAIDAEEVPLDIEEVALFWLNKSSERFRQVIEDELNNNESESINYIPCLPFIHDITELNTGCSLVALLSFYCPEYLNWREVCLKESDEMSDENCIKNLETVQYFCAKYLPYDICFIELDNLIKIKNQMRINLLTFISDLLYLFEVKPATCVKRPEYEYDELDLDFKENERINHNNNLTMSNKKKMRDLVAADLRTRSQQHTSWTNDEEEDNLNEEIRNQQKRLRNYLQQQQPLPQHQHSHEQQQSNYDLSNEFYLDQSELRKANRLNHDLQSLSLNKDLGKDCSSSENEFYLNPAHHTSHKNHLNNHNHHNSHNNHNNNQLINSDGSETSSTLSFAKLSKIKNHHSISHNLNEVDNPSINVVYSSDQDDYLTANKKHHSSKKKNSILLHQQQQLDQQQDNQFTNGASNNNGSEQDEAEIANQILQIHMKLEEKKKQIELEKHQIESHYKTQKRDISNEAFLKALKIEKMNNSSSLKENDNLNAFEIKESLNSLRSNLPANQLKSDQYYNDIKSSIDILSSSVIDLEKDLTQLEEEKLMVKQQKHNLDQLIDQQQKSISNQMQNSLEQNNDSSKFYLHNSDKSADNQLLNSLIQNNKLNNLHHLQNDFYPQQQDDYMETTKSLNQKLMVDSLNSMHAEQLPSNNSNLRRASLQSGSKNVLDNMILNNNNEKGFFIPFDAEQKKPSRSKPPVLNNHSNRKDNDELDKCIIDDKSIILSQQQQQLDAVGFVIGHDLISPDPKSEFAKAKKKEFIMNQSMKRKAEQEEKLRVLKDETSRKCEEERKKREQIEKRKEENRSRREAILEQHRLRKLQEEVEKEGGTIGKLIDSKSTTLRNRHQNLSSLNRARPKTIHLSSNVNQDQNNFASLDFRASSKLVSDHLDAALINNHNYSNSILSNTNNSFTSSSFTNSLRPQSSLSTNAMKKLYTNSSSKHNLPSLPPFMLGTNRLHKGSGSSDGVSEIGSTYSEYTGPKLYVKPIQKSNRGIIVNAINVVLGGAVNVPTKKKVLEEINNNDSKHFLILFRGSGMQFRAIYTYNPDIEEIIKLYGTGPKIINNDMIDKFYKYNSGGKNFNEVHTKHLTVTIDAVTIHSQLWSGKKMPIKKDALLI